MPLSSTLHAALNREGYLKGKAQYGSAPFYVENFIYLYTKLATLMRRSTVLSLPLQLVFHVLSGSMYYSVRIVTYTSRVNVGLVIFMKLIVAASVNY
jgi:hypothetical protein